MSYEEIARIYDAAVEDTSEALATQALRALAMSGVPSGSKVADLACGTGIASVHLAEAGFVVEGHDLSPAMLARARARAEARQLAIEFVEGDLLDLDIAGFDAAICMHDSLNHIAADRLVDVFANVARALGPSGVFAFDVNLVAGGRALSGHHLVLEEEDRLTTFQIETDDRKMRTRVTLFERTGEVWSRTDEVLEQNLFTTQFVEGALEDAGFVVVKSEGIDAVGVHTLKQLFVARR